MPRFRFIHPPLLLAAAALLCACPGPSTADVPAPADRQGFALPSSEPERAAALTRATDGALCMRTSGRTDCDFGVCVALAPAERAALRARLEAAVQAVGRSELTPPRQFYRGVRASVPTAVPASRISDAQGAQACGGTGQRACAAVRYEDLWLLASGPGQPAGARADSLTVFLARNPCGASPVREE